jgi:hypothetical protein
MTLLQFIESKSKEETPIGDLARDTYRDKEFQTIQTDEERLSHLSYVTGNVSEVYDDFLKEFNSVK